MRRTIIIFDFYNYGPAFQAGFSYGKHATAFGIFTFAGGEESLMRDKPVDQIQAVYHLVEHTPFYYNASVLVKSATVLALL